MEFEADQNFDCHLPNGCSHTVLEIDINSLCWSPVCTQGISNVTRSLLQRRPERSRGKRGCRLDIVATTAMQLTLFISRNSSRVPVRIRPAAAAARQFIRSHSSRHFIRRRRSARCAVCISWQSTVDASVFLSFIRHGLIAHRRRFLVSPRLVKSKLIWLHGYG